MEIGKKDSNGIELKNGDNIIIEVCKPDGFNRSGVYHKGVIVYENCAYCLKVERVKDVYNINPICNYSSTCKITKIN